MKQLAGVVLFIAIGALTAGCRTSPPPDPVAAAPGGDTTPSAEAPAPATPAPATPAPIAATTVTPVPSPTAVAVTAEDRIAAALAALDEHGASDLVAWDVLETRMVGETWVAIIVCGWDGETAFDSRYLTEWSTQIGPDGVLSATEVDTVHYSGECVNTALIESALAFTRAYDELREIEAAQPGTEASLSLARELHTPEFHTGFAQVSIQRGQEGIWAILGSTAPLPDSAVAPVLWARSRTDDGTPRLEIVACRDMNPDHGLYRHEEILDDSKEGTIEGPHGILRYELVADLNAERRWRLNSIESTVWGDCYFTGDWLGVVSDGYTGRTWNEYRP